MLPLLLLCATNTHKVSQRDREKDYWKCGGGALAMHLQTNGTAAADKPFSFSLSATTTNNHGNIIVHDKHRAELQNWKGRKMSKNDRSLWDSKNGNRKSSTATVKLAAAVLMRVWRASLAPLPLRRRSKQSERQRKAENERRRLKKKKKKWKRNNPRKKEKTRGEIRGKKIGREKEEDYVWKASPFPSSSSSSAYLILLYCYINSCAAVQISVNGANVKRREKNGKERRDRIERKRRKQHNTTESTRLAVREKETDTFLIQ